jgi:hypothetical protein
LFLFIALLANARASAIREGARGVPVYGVCAFSFMMRHPRAEGSELARGFVSRLLLIAR